MVVSFCHAQSISNSDSPNKEEGCDRFDRKQNQKGKRKSDHLAFCRTHTTIGSLFCSTNRFLDLTEEIAIASFLMDINKKKIATPL